jgi:hypothetical protein
MNRYRTTSTHVRIRAGALALLALLACRAGAAEPDTVPLHFINSLPFVGVRVGAVGSDMLFDSGGPLSISIPPSAAAASGAVTLLAEQAKFRDIQGEVHEVPMVVAKDIVIGRTPLPPVRGRIHVQWGGAPEGPDAPLTRARQAGAVGLGVFGDRPVMLDYAHGTMTLYAPGEGPQPGDAGWQTLRLEFGRIGPSVVLDVAGKPLRFVLDTGSPVTLVKPDSLPTKDGAGDCAPCLLSNVRDDSGHPIDALRVHTVALGDVPFDGLLGAPFFSDRRVVFDVAAHRLLISAEGKSGQRPYISTHTMP